MLFISMSSSFSTTTTDIVLYALHLLLAILFTATTSQADPLPAKQTAFARVGRYLYVQGGIVRLENKFTPANQFFALDLEASWSVHAPRWKALSSNNSYTPSVGLHTKVNHSDMFTTLFPTTSRNCFISSYNTTSGSWLPDMTTSAHEVMDPAFLSVAVPYSDSIYIVSSNMMSILKLDDGSIRSIDIPANIFSMSRFGGAVHNGDQILYIGGSTTPGDLQTSVKAFNLISERWDTLV